MSRRYTRWCVAALGATAGIAMVAAVSFDNAGFCFPERRFLSDAEKIEAAAHYAALRGFHVRFRVAERVKTLGMVSCPTPTRRPG